MDSAGERSLKRSTRLSINLGSSGKLELMAQPPYDIRTKLLPQLHLSGAKFLEAALEIVYAKL